MTLGGTMKKIIMILSLVTIISSCGKDEGAKSPAEVDGRDPILTGDIDSFVGSYDLVQADSEDCGVSVQIIRACDGIQIRSTQSGNKSFCNVNKGEIITGDKRSSSNVTFEENVVKSVANIFDERSIPAGQIKEVITHTLSINAEGELLKQLESKAGISSCLYQKL